MEPISNMFSSILNNERRHKHECIVYPASKLMGQVLRVMQKYGYVGEFEFVDDGRGGKFKIQLLGRVNDCGSVRPRFSSTIGEFEKWGKRFLPSRDVGILILTTPKGVLAQGGARGRSWGPAPRIRLLNGETSWPGLRLSKERYLSPTRYPSRSKDEQSR